MRAKMEDIAHIQEAYYSKLYNDYKGTPMAVSSESLKHKELRYKNISGVFGEEDSFSLHDVGMGLGDYYGFLNKYYSDRKIIYSGSDILQDYVIESSRRFPDRKFYLRNLATSLAEDKYDYLILSGVFHQRRDTSIKNWEQYMQILISNCFAMSNKGIAFNAVTQFVDYYQPNIYYCNIHKLIEFINHRLSRFFTLKHDYALYELTVYVYKEEYIQHKYNEKEFEKYFHIKKK